MRRFALLVGLSFTSACFASTDDTTPVSSAGSSCPTCKGHSGGAAGGAASAAGGVAGSGGQGATSGGGGSNGAHGSSGAAASSGGAQGVSSSAGASSGGVSSTGAAASSSGGGSSGGASSTGAVSNGGSTGSTETCGNNNQPPPDGGCFSSEPAYGPCFTNADCQSPYWCGFYANCEVGLCFPPSASSTPLACVANGGTCTADGPVCCSGTCQAGTCVAWSACGGAQASCQSDTDCCNGFACQGGTCQPTCAGLYGHCQSTNDCCWEQGLSCLNIDYGTGSAVSCFYEGLVDTGQTCGAPCSALECDLGTTCALDPTTDADPCNPAGLVCDLTYNTCREPRYNVGDSFYPEPCLPNGPPCQPIANSQAQTVCAPVPNPDLGGAVGNYCVQACDTTADCIDPLTTCEASPGGGGGNYCAFWNPCQSSQFFGACNAESTDDGLCYPANFGYGVTGFCTQASEDGGGPQSRCIAFDADNRENGGFCDEHDLCTAYGLCLPACNAGASGPDGGPGCPAGQDCIDYEGTDSYPVTIGFCSVACNFTSASGGGCGTDTSGIQEKCLPLAFWTGQDVASGFCAAASPAPIAVDQPCPNQEATPVTATGDPCVPGAMCLSLNPFLNSWTCTQLCDAVGTEGIAGCSAGQSCCPMPLGGGVQPVHTGYCAASCN